MRSGAPRGLARRRGQPRRRAARRGRRGLRRARRGHARLPAKERLPLRRARALGRGRLVAGRDGRRRRGRARPRFAAWPCRPLLLAAARSTTRSSSRAASTSRSSTVPIEAAHAALASSLAGPLGDEPAGLTDENLQSRIRGVLLMAVSNATGAIVLTTGNKSELATGYSTLYGDSAGGFAVIKDVPKTLVYELCRYRNRRALDDGDEPPIPDAVLDKPPSAELRPDQRDDAVAAALRGARPRPRALRRRRPHGRGAHRRRPRRRARRARRRAGRPPRVQAPPDAPGRAHRRARPSAATAGCPSPTRFSPEP